MNKKEVVNVDLVDVPHIRVEVESEQVLEEGYAFYQDCQDDVYLGTSEFFKMKNRFESCFIVYRESMPDMMIYAQE